jgi:predicted PurR-regulated permease PerM
MEIPTARTHAEVKQPGSLTGTAGVYKRLLRRLVPAPPVRQQHRGITAERLKIVALLVITVLVAYLCYLLLMPFLPAIVWAIALAVVALPLQVIVERRIRNANLAAATTVLAVTIVLVIPIVIVAQQVIQEAASAIEAIRSGELRGHVQSALEKNPQIALATRWLQERLDLGRQAESIAGTAAALLRLAFAGSAAGVTQLVIALFTLFFVLRDRRYFSWTLRGLIPLSEPETDEVLTSVQNTIDASLRGRVVIAVIQGVLGGLMFWWLGLRAPLLWGTAMALLATIPLFGAFVVWIPAAIYLAVTGDMTKAIILTLWGALVIGTIDNFLYPILVGKNLQLHTIVIFFSVLGGVAAFGISGLVMGPVIVALADALIEIWERRMSTGRGEMLAEQAA